MKAILFISLVLFVVSCSLKENKTTLRITSVYPTTDTLPENLLRLYIQFSQPMKAVNNLENLKLLDENEKEIKGAIFNNVYELWDSEQKQLTIILDPARVKTDLVVNSEQGRALQSGKYYKLVIEKAEGIDGQQLPRPFTKQFFVTEEDREAPNTDNWMLIPPSSLKNSSLSIHFPQVLDQMSLLHRIRIVGPDNNLVSGKIELENKEKLWRFTPSSPWEKGIYTIQVNSRLEDPAGNNLNGLFDHELGGLKSQQEGEIINMEFEIHQ